MSLPIIRYRLLSITMLLSFMLLGVKVGDIFRGGHQISQALVTQASAQQEAPPAAAENPPAGGIPAPAKTDAAIVPDANGNTTKPADTVKPTAPGVAAVKSEPNPPDASDPASTEASLKAGDQNVGDVQLPGSEAKPEQRREFTQVDLDLLQSLSRRRDEIEDWAKQVELKENMLGATEQRIKDKIAQLKDLQKQLDKVLAQYNQHEDAKIRSLVKIYENMKPGDAARIFDELEMPIMLEVVDKMSERKAAPIFANMNPTKAKELTVELAAQRKLQQPMVDAISASQAEGASATPPAPVADSKEEAPTPPALSIPAAPAAPAPAAPSPQPSAPAQ